MLSVCNIYSGRINKWNSHSKLFKSITQSTTLYGSHIWGPQLFDIIEKVQKKFIKRLFQLDSRVAGYALRLETESTKLEIQIVSQTLKFLTKVFQMSETTITKKCYRKLRSIYVIGEKNDKYNWLGNVYNILEHANKVSIWQQEDYRIWSLECTSIISNYCNYLKRQDLECALQSRKNSYYAE